MWLRALRFAVTTAASASLTKTGGEPSARLSLTRVAERAFLSHDGSERSNVIRMISHSREISRQSVFKSPLGHDICAGHKPAAGTRKQA